jgi:signal transduction histidine kinase
MQRVRTIVTYIAAYFFTFGTILRCLVGYHPQDFTFPLYIPLAAFIVLFVIEPYLSRISNQGVHYYLGVQTAIITFLLYISPQVDFFAVLFFVLTLQAFHRLDERIGFRWVLVFIAIMAGMMIYIFGPNAGIGLVLNYSIAYLMVAGLVTITKTTERAQEESQRLLRELQVAHQQLQSYAEQVEELTAEEERNRLARNLHDSVTQTIFTMTLTAEAAKILIERSKEQTIEQLDKLLELARSALGEMRSLIFELRPTVIADQGLMPALLKYLTGLEDHTGLKVDLGVRGDPDLPTRHAQRLFYVIREALNNIVKHANVDKASVELRFGKDTIELCVEDRGRGFDMKAVDLEGENLGLTSMRERIEKWGGDFTIESRIGEGTRVLAAIPIHKEDSDEK